MVHETRGFAFSCQVVHPSMTKHLTRKLQTQPSEWLKLLQNLRFCSRKNSALSFCQVRLDCDPAQNCEDKYQAKSTNAKFPNEVLSLRFAAVFRLESKSFTRR